MPTARCKQCGKLDFAPELACKACAHPYDDATQAKVTMAALADSAAPADHCTTCGRAMTADGNPSARLCTECATQRSQLQKAGMQKARGRAEKAASTLKTKETMLGLAGLAVAAAIFSGFDSRETSTATNGTTQPVQACSASDAMCLGIAALDRSYAPCVRAIEAYAIGATRWTNGFLEQRFNTSIGWYQPDQRTIIYTGNQLEVSSGSDSWQRRNYFCVWSLDDQMVVKAGFPD